MQRELLTNNGDLAELTNDLIASRDALRRSEAYLAEGERISRTGSYAWNPRTGELVWSKEHCRIFGGTADQQRQTYASLRRSVYRFPRSQFAGAIALR
jgi:hypothetical protein